MDFKTLDDVKKRFPNAIVTNGDVDVNDANIDYTYTFSRTGEDHGYDEGAHLVYITPSIAIEGKEYNDQGSNWIGSVEELGNTSVGDSRGGLLLRAKLEEINVAESESLECTWCFDDEEGESYDIAAFERMIKLLETLPNYKLDLGIDI